MTTFDVTETHARALLIISPECPGFGLERLDGPAQDRSLMEKLVESGLGLPPSCEVRTVDGVSNQRVSAALAWLYDPKSPSADGILFLYYSGHVVHLRSNETAFASRDSSEDDPMSVITATSLQTFILNCPRALHFWILDACYSQGMISSSFPQIVQGMFDHVVIASSSLLHGTLDGTTGKASPFTKSLSDALHGLAVPADVSETRLSALLDYLAADSSRRRTPAPYFHYAGRGTGLHFSSRSGPSQRQSPIYIASRKSKRSEGLFVAAGESHRYQDAYLAGKAGFDHAFVRMDGRSLTQLELSKIATGARGTNSPDPLLVYGASDTPVWHEAVTAASLKKVIVTVGNLSDVPAHAFDEVESVLAHSPTTQDAEKLQKTYGVAADLPGDALERFVEACGGSMHELERLMRAATFLDKAEQGLQDEGIGSLALPNVVERLKSANLSVRDVLEVCAAVPDVYLPIRSLISFLIHGGLSAESAERTINSVVHAGLVTETNNHVTVPRVFADQLQTLYTEYARSFVRFIEYALAGSATQQLTAVERFQILRAAVYFTESHLWSDGKEELVDRVFSSTAMELIYSARQRAWLPLIEQIDRWLGQTRSFPASLVLGHAYRLADEYQTSMVHFEDARRRAKTSPAKRAVQAGLLRLAVQSGGATRLPDQLVEVPPVQLEESGDRAEALSVAQLHLQEGSSAFRLGNLAAAKRRFDLAEQNLMAYDPVTGSMLVDVLKARGDVALDQNDINEAAHLVDRIFDAVVEYGLNRFGRVAWAKSLQFAGDVARRLARPDHAPGETSLSRRRVLEADYWYVRAEEEYENQELILGTLISRFKHAELRGLTGLYQEARAAHISLVGQFDDLDNALWKFRSQVAVIRVDIGSGRMQDLLTSSYAHEIEYRLRKKDLPQIDLLWGNLTLGVWRDDAQFLTRARDIAEMRGCAYLGDFVAVDPSGSWLFSHFSST